MAKKLDEYLTDDVAYDAQAKIAKGIYEYFKEDYQGEHYRILCHQGAKHFRAPKGSDAAIEIGVHVARSGELLTGENKMMLPDLAVVDSDKNVVLVLVEIEADDEISQKHVVGDIATANMCGWVRLARDDTVYDLKGVCLFVVLCARFYGEDVDSDKPAKMSLVKNSLMLGEGSLPPSGFYISGGKNAHEAFDRFVSDFEGFRESAIGRSAHH